MANNCNAAVPLTRQSPLHLSAGRTLDSRLDGGVTFLRMKKNLKTIAAVLFVAFIAIQFYRPTRENLPIIPEQTLEATTQVPENIQQTFRRSCNDCHTSNTDWRWYSNVAPVSWKMVEHVEEGRKELNFSVWATYTTSRKLKKLDEICEEVTSKAMPLDQYVWIHWDIKLSDEEINSICEWTKKESES